jgi:hypothetical protein
MRFFKFICDYLGMYWAGRLDVEAASLFKLTMLASSPLAYGEVLPGRANQSKKFVEGSLGGRAVELLRVVRGRGFKPSEEFSEPK